MIGEGIYHNSRHNCSLFCPFVHMSDRKVFIPHKETYDDLAESPTFRSYPMGDYRDGFANYNGSGQAETTDHLDIDPNTGYLRHVVSMSDSLNSLALKYHVKV